MKSTLLTSRNKNTKKIEKTTVSKTGPESSNPPPVNQGGGFTRQNKKIKVVKGSFPRNFPQFKVSA